jgi:hypothetical protein
VDERRILQAYGLRNSSVGALKIPGNNVGKIQFLNRTWQPLRRFCLIAMIWLYVQLFPAKLMTKIYNLIQSQASSIDGLNVELFTHTPVLKIERSAVGKPTWMVHTSRGKFESYSSSSLHKFPNCLMLTELLIFIAALENMLSMQPTPTPVTFSPS